MNTLQWVAVAIVFWLLVALAVFSRHPAHAQNLADPCTVLHKTSVPISQTGNTRLVAGTPGKINYICSMLVVTADAEDLSLVEGTGSNCGTNTSAIIGGTTAAGGPNFAAGGGFALANGGATVASGSNKGYDVCLLQSGNGQQGGVLTYVAQ